MTIFAAPVSELRNGGWGSQDALIADRLLRYVTEGDFGHKEQATSNRSDPIRAAQPVDDVDAFGGKICAHSGLWFPASRLRRVNGAWYGDIFAPQPKRLGPGGRRL